MQNWAPFQPDEVPNALPLEIQSLLIPIQQCAAASLVCVTELALIRAVSSPVFAAKVSQTSAASGSAVVMAALFDSVTLTLCALFTEKQVDSTFRPIMKKLSHVKHHALLQQWHDRMQTGVVVAREQVRLTCIQRRLNRGDLRQSFNRVDGMRDNAVAHLKFESAASEHWPTLRDIMMLVVAVSNVANTTVRLISTRGIKVSACWQNAQHQASSFSDSVRPSRIRGPFVFSWNHNPAVSLMSVDPTPRALET